MAEAAVTIAAASQRLELLWPGPAPSAPPSVACPVVEHRRYRLQQR